MRGRSIIGGEGIKNGPFLSSMEETMGRWVLTWNGHGTFMYPGGRQWGLRETHHTHSLSLMRGEVTGKEDLYFLERYL